MVPIDRDKHLKIILDEIEELNKLEKRVMPPAEIPHRYIGTIVYNSVAMLMTPANSLDHGSRRAIYTDDKDWISLMSAIHRSFLVTLHIATEKGIDEILDKYQINVSSSTKKKVDKEIKKTKRIPKETQKFMRRLVKNFKPTFEDKLNELLSSTKLKKKSREKWKVYFKALTVVRNKSSHSISDLSLEERETLTKGGLASVISMVGQLQFSSDKCHQLASIILDFFDEIYLSIKL